uniref:Large ribosomal subunit protein eL24-related N-terminal domain-containing protein n=2 Tax=Oryza TaxID=4527 RepID=A0A0E0JJH9_ORYPU
MTRAHQVPALLSTCDGSVVRWCRPLRFRRPSGAKEGGGGMRLEKCWFCSSTIYPGHGIQFVRNDAKCMFRLTMEKRALLCSGFLEEEIFLSRMLQNLNKAVSEGIWIFRFCRSKCHKNFKMKRNPRKVKWTKAYRCLHGKDMTQDSTFEFERKRNRPERYDRNVTAQTLKAIPLITKIRHERQKKHITERQKQGKTKERERDAKELEQDIQMLPKKDTMLSTQKTKVVVKVSQQQTEENLMEE